MTENQTGRLTSPAPNPNSLIVADEQNVLGQEVGRALVNSAVSDKSNIVIPTLAARFRALFSGLERAHGAYNHIDQTREDGKRTGVAVTLREPVTDEKWAQHLAGQNGLGIIAVRDDATAVFGAIDVDQYSDLDHGRMAATVARLGLPLVTCRSKSGGCHLYLFTKQPVDAGTMQDRLREIAAKLGHGGAEIFPKQRKLMPKECGGWINACYFDMSQTTRYAVNAAGDALTAEEFLNLAEGSKVGVEFFTPAASASQGQEPLPGGPPCLQHLVTLGFPEGTRNDSLTNIAIYFKHVNPDSFASDVEAFNRQHMQLGSQEVANIIKSVGKKDYQYTCNKQPLTPYCNAVLCRTRKYGIGGGTAASLPVLGSLTKYDSKPPLYWWDIDGLRIELTTDEITDYRKFKRICFERLDKVLPPLSAKKWDELLRKGMEKLTTEPVPEDASPEGQFWELLETFCNGRSQACSREELVGTKPLLEDGRVYFRLAGLLAFLDRERFRHLSMQRITAVLNSRGGRPEKLTVEGKQVRVWSVPAFAPRRADAWAVPARTGEARTF